MQARIIFFFISILFLAACSGNQNTEKLPEGVLSEQKMTEVLVDIHILQAALNLSAIKIDNKDFYKNDRFYDLYKKHDITENDFTLSFQHYTRNPEKLKLIYTEVLKDLSTKQAEALKSK